MSKQPMNERLLTDAIHYAELGSPTKGREAVEQAVAQAKAEGRREMFDFASKVLEFAEHGDYSNGNDDASGTDEGRVRAGEMLDALRKEWQALQKG